MKNKQESNAEIDPTEGGSYIRNVDGSLTKVKLDDEPAPANPADDTIEPKD